MVYSAGLKYRWNIFFFWLGSRTFWSSLLWVVEPKWLFSGLWPLHSFTQKWQSYFCSVCLLFHPRGTSNKAEHDRASKVKPITVSFASQMEQDLQIQDRIYHIWVWKLLLQRICPCDDTTSCRYELTRLDRKSLAPYIIYAICITKSRWFMDLFLFLSLLNKCASQLFYVFTISNYLF